MSVRFVNPLFLLLQYAPAWRVSRFWRAAGRRRRAKLVLTSRQRTPEVLCRPSAAVGSARETGCAGQQTSAETSAWRPPVVPHAAGPAVGSGSSGRTGGVVRRAYEAARWGIASTPFSVRELPVVAPFDLAFVDRVLVDVVVLVRASVVSVLAALAS